MQHAEERRTRAQDELARLQRDYSEMSEERKENDKLVEETKAEAAELERKVATFPIGFRSTLTDFFVDEGARSEE